MPTLDVSAAFYTLPNLLSGSYYQRTSTGFPQTYAAPVTCPYKATRVSLAEDQPSGAYYKRFRTSFKLPQDVLADDPVIGDKFTDAEQVDWIVIDFHRGLANLSLGCVLLSVDSHSVEWRKVKQQTNVFGDRVTARNNFDSGGTFNCRIQPATNDVLDIFGKRGLLGHYIVFTLADEQFKFGDLLVDHDDNDRTYVIRDWRSREDIQNANMILCEVQP